MATRGKKLTSTQRKILAKDGIQNTEDYLYVGIRHIDPDGYKSPSKNQVVKQKMVFINRYSGKERIVEI